MPEAQQVVAPPVATPIAAPDAHEEAGAPVDVDARAAMLVEQLRGQSDIDDADEPDELAPVAKPVAKGKPAPADEPTEADPEAERRAKVDRAAELERDMLSRRAKVQERETRAQQAEQSAQQMLAKAEAMMKAAEERTKAFDSPLGTLEALRAKVSPEQLQQWLLDAQSPAKVAEWQANKVKTETSSETDKIRQEMLQLKQELQAERAAKHQQNVEQEFLETAKQADTRPYVASLLAKRPGELIARANHLADSLVAKNGSASYEQILDAIESDLSDYVSTFAPQQPGAPAQSSVEPGQASANKARTLSSRTTAGRSTVADDDGDGLRSIDDRAAQLKKALRRSG